MVKHGKIKYEWLTNDGLVYIDFHGEVKQQVKPQQTYYESYTLGYSNNMAGSLLAPFEGRMDGISEMILTKMLR